MTLGLVAGLLMVELGLRSAGFDYPTLYLADPERGYALLPGAETRWQREGSADIRINAAGLRDRDHIPAKPPDTVRIAILGDSFAEALQVPLETTFWAVLEQALTARDCFGGQAVEVINFGVGGYGTAQELLTLRGQVWAYDPDLVLLAFFPGNDVKNNAFALEQNPEYPYFVLHDGVLIQDDRFPTNKHLRFRQLFGYGSKYLRIFGVVQLVKDRLRLGGFQPPSPPAAEEVWTEFGVDNAVFQPPGIDAWRSAWGVTEALLQAMHRETRARQVDFLLVTLTTGIAVHPDPTIRANFKRHLAIDTLFYPETRLAALADREAIPLLILGPPFQAHAEANQVYLHGFENAHLGGGHWNIAGHQLAGKLIADKLCSEFRVQSSGF